MRDVKLVRLSDDGTHVVLTHEGTGEEFALRIDDRLRGFVTSDRARLSQLPLERPSRLSPKEIQARLRAGESSEDIAAAADVSMERVMRYAGPVLAEREYVAEQAQSALLRRSTGGQGGSQGRPLGSAVTERLDTLGANTGQVRWDAWRMPDGRWAIAVFYHLPGTTQEAQATFGFDPVGRTVIAIDEAGEWMLGDGPAAQNGEPPNGSGVVEGPGPRTPRDARPRLAAVPSPPEEAGAAGQGEAAQDPVVRTLHPTPSEPEAPTANDGSAAGEAPSAGDASDDEIAYEPTVDLTRSMHDQPQPSPAADQRSDGSRTQSQPGHPARSRPAAARPASPQEPSPTGGDRQQPAAGRGPRPQTPSEPTEPPRLSPDDLPDLGESTRSAPAPTPPPADAAGAAPATPSPSDGAGPTADQSASAPPPAPASVPDPAPGPSTGDAAPASEPVVAESPSGAPVSGTTDPVETTDAAEGAAQQAAKDAVAPRPAETVEATTSTAEAASPPATADTAVQTDAADATASAGGSPAAADAADATADAASQDAAETTGTAEESQPAEAEEGERQAGSASGQKKGVGQDRRTSSNRRRRASGSKRKGAVPSWDDILFGSGGGNSGSGKD